MQIGFIGLGNMGYSMAGHIALNNYDISVYNRTIAKSRKWGDEYKARYCESYQDVITASDVLILCVGNDQDVEKIITSDQGVYHNMKSGGIVIDHTTTSASIARMMSELLLKKEICFLDSPVSGGQIGAQKGELTTMVGGSEHAYTKIENILKCYSKKVSYMGESGNGQLSKMVNQICLASIIQGLSEGINFAINAGIDPYKVIDAISHGAAGSWQMNNRATTMIGNKFDFGFAVRLMLKDLGICLNEAKNNNSELPVTALINQFYMKLVNMGCSEYDTSSLIKLLQQEK